MLSTLSCSWEYIKAQQKMIAMAFTCHILTVQNQKFLSTTIDISSKHMQQAVHAEDGGYIEHADELENQIISQACSMLLCSMSIRKVSGSKQ